MNLGSVLSFARLPAWVGQFMWPEYQIAICESRFGTSQSALLSLKHKKSGSFSEEEFILVRASMSANNKFKTWLDTALSSLLQLTLLWAGGMDWMISRSSFLPISVIQWCCQIIKWKCPVKRQKDARLCCNWKLLKAVILSCAKSFTIAGRLS